jgi:ribosomal protein S6
MLLLFRPDIAQEMYNEIRSRLEAAVLDENMGKVVSFDRWGKYLLAYQVKKCSYGVYSLFRFGLSSSCGEAVLLKLRSLCLVKFNNDVMRHVFVKVGAVAPGEYCRPDSLEDMPRKDTRYSSEFRRDGASSNRAAGQSRQVDSEVIDSSF